MAHKVEFSHANKIFFPKTKITKGDLLVYYENVADIFVAHARNHPLAMQRFPDGIDAEGFYHKDVPDYFPSWIARVPIRRRLDHKITAYPLCNDRETLLYLVNQGVITFHQWQSSVGALDKPDRMVFDLDPGPGVNFGALKKTARQLCTVLEHYELTSFVMTTGSHGLHVVVPLKPIASFARVFRFAGHVTDTLIAKNPQLLTRQVRKKERTGKIFIDTLRNRWAQLAVVPYSVRPIEGAPVATPLAWAELSHRGLSSQSFNITNMCKRLKTHKDPWATIDSQAQQIPERF